MYRLPRLYRQAIRLRPPITFITTGSILSNNMSSNAPVPPVQKTEEEWRAVLSKEQFRVLRQKGTERAGTGEYEHTKDDGEDILVYENPSH